MHIDKIALERINKNLTMAFAIAFMFLTAIFAQTKETIDLVEEFKQSEKVLKQSIETAKKYTLETRGKSDFPQRLDKAQKAWLKFRDAECEYLNEKVDKENILMCKTYINEKQMAEYFRLIPDCD